MLMTRWKKTSFSISLMSSKLTISLISIYKLYTINIADPSSMQDTCHMNFVIDLTHHGVSVAQWLEYQSAEIWRSEVRFLMGNQNFSLSHTHDKEKKTHLSLMLKFSWGLSLHAQIKSSTSVVCTCVINWLWLISLKTDTHFYLHCPYFLS